jgi:hypothetical protein
MPGADEAPEEHELGGVLTRRADHVERRYQPCFPLARICVPSHWAPPKQTGW